MSETTVGAMPPAPPRPTPGPSRPWAFPAVETRDLGDGLTLLCAPVRTLPLVSVMVVTDAGADTDAPGREGLAQLTARAMTEGTARRDGAALALAAEQLGTAIDASADWDGAYASFTALTDRLEPALALLAEVVTEPSFPVREVERLQAERLADIAQTEAEPRGLADERFTEVAYAPGSRFAVSAGGTRASIGSLDAAACRAHHAARWRRGGSTVIVVGDIDADRAAALVRGAFMTWTGTVPARPTLDDRRTPAGGRVTIIDRPGAAQSELRVGHVAVRRLHPDYFPLVLGNAILGGLFNSRLNLNLRERHGYTYGAGSGFEWRREAGPFVAHAAVATDVTEPALREMLSELAAIRETPVSETELSLAQSYLDGVFPLRYESTGAIANALAARVVYGLSEDWFVKYRERVRAVSAEAILSAMDRHLDPAQWQVVIVGDAATIAPVLQGMGLGPVDVRPSEGA